MSTNTRCRCTLAKSGKPCQGAIQLEFDPIGRQPPRTVRPPLAYWYFLTTRGHPECAWRRLVPPHNAALKIETAYHAALKGVQLAPILRGSRLRMEMPGAHQEIGS